jgi:flagellar biosynthesis protein
MRDDKKKAVALRYKKGEDTAPKVITKRIGKIAERIIEVARKEKIAIIEDKAAADKFYAVDVNVEIPPEMYKVAAELLAFVYTLDKKGRTGGVKAPGPVPPKLS